MPRSRGRSAGPAPRQQTRSAHTMSAPSSAHAAHPQPVVVQGQRQPGLFSQMASTAAGVAVGSAAGHTIANGVSALFGGSRQEEYPVEQQQAAQPLQAQSASGQCEFDARGLTECLDTNGGDMRVCQWYVDQLKACLNAAK